jgi:hypothetical protein
MYTNRTHSQARVSYYSVMRDATTETRDLHVSVLRAGASRLCLSHVVTLHLEVLFQTFGFVFLIYFHIVSITRPVFHTENTKRKDWCFLFKIDKELFRKATIDAAFWRNVCHLIMQDLYNRLMCLMFHYLLWKLQLGFIDIVLGYLYLLL